MVSDGKGCEGEPTASEVGVGKVDVITGRLSWGESSDELESGRCNALESEKKSLPMVPRVPHSSNMSLTSSGLGDVN
jgi:hypothetical protein